MRSISIDVETFSTEDVKLGVHKYCTRVELLLFAYSIDRGPVQVVDVAQGETIPEEVIDALFDKNFIKKAWNAAFEIEVLESYLCVPMKLAQWQCTMVKSARCGYPLSLDKAAKAIGLPIEKDTAGKALIKLFSVPRKPTKNNPATRVYPADNPEKWAQYIEYNRRDVEVEMAIDDFLSQYPAQPEFEQKMYVLDRQINKRGIELDIPFIEKAVELDAEYKERLTEQAKVLTGLDNPNSVAQLKGWLEEKTGRVWKGLDKAVLKSAMEEEAIPYAEEKNGEIVLDGSMVSIKMTEEVKQLLELRKELSNTSVKKYIAMLASNVGGRIYDTIQFNGAGRTGRNAGRLIQPQNLPRVYMEDETLDLARRCVKTGNLEMLELMFGSVSSALSQLIRTALIAKEGHILKVVDLSAIEARVLAWLAGEEHVLQVFRTHGKIYEATAAMMFKVPFESVTKGSIMRQRGKVASLACIAEGSRVLTDSGLVPIENVTTDHKLWDGIEWVTHRGVIYKGLKNVITYDGLQATEDHLVWVEGSKGPVPFGLAAARGQNLLQSGSGRKEIRLGKNNICGEKVYEGLVRPICFREVRELRERRVGSFCKLKTRSFEGMSKLFNSRKITSQVVQKAYGGKTEMFESKGPKLRQLRGAGNKIQLPNSFRSCALYVRKLRGSRFEQSFYRPYRQQFPLPKRQSAVCNPRREFIEQKNYCIAFLGSGPVALRSNCCSSIPFTGFVSSGDNGESLRSRNTETKELERDKTEVRVFDILNSGPRNRFTVSNVLVHNCGYQGGANAISTMDIDKSIPDEDKPGLVRAWREAHPNIVRFWYKTQDCAIKAIKNPGEKVPLTKGAYFVVTGGALLFYLPSGRYLMYPKVGLEDGQYGPKIIFWGLDQTTGQWRKQDTYGGKLVENCISLNEKILTESGIKLAKDVLPSDRLWDGLNWVSHGGLVLKGIQKTISVNGIRLTPDHKILTDEGWKNASSCQGLNRFKVQPPDGGILRGFEWKKIIMEFQMRLWNFISFTCKRVYEEKTKILRVFTIQNNIREEENTRYVEAPRVLGLEIYERQVPATHPSSVAQLWWPWDNSMQRLERILQEFLERYGSVLQRRLNFGENRCKWGLRTGELHVGRHEKTTPEQTDKCFYKHTLGAHNDCRGLRKIWGRFKLLIQQSKKRSSGKLIVRETGRQEQVCDFLNVGPLNRFTVLDENNEMLIVHNCTQAVARDVLMEGMYNMVRKGYNLVTNVHDETVAETEIGFGSIEEIEQLMCDMPAWADGLPLGAEGFESEYYKK